MVLHNWCGKYIDPKIVREVMQNAELVLCKFPMITEELGLSTCRGGRMYDEIACLFLVMIFFALIYSISGTHSNVITASSGINYTILRHAVMSCISVN